MSVFIKRIWLLHIIREGLFAPNAQECLISRTTTESSTKPININVMKCIEQTGLSVYLGGSGPIFRSLILANSNETIINIYKCVPHWDFECLSVFWTHSPKCRIICTRMTLSAKSWIGKTILNTMRTWLQLAPRQLRGQVMCPPRYLSTMRHCEEFT